MKLTEKLAVLQALTETELRRSVLIDLFDAMDYVRIEDVHGPIEDGRDLVFRRSTPLLDEEFTAVVLKAHKITGNVEDSKGMKTVLFQTQDAISRPHRDNSTGDEVTITKCFIVTSYEIDPFAKRSIPDHVGTLAGRVIRFLDGPKLVQLIDEYLPERFLGTLHSHSEYFRTLYRHNYLVKNLKELGATQDRTVYDIYTGGSLVDFSPQLRHLRPDAAH